MNKFPRIVNKFPLIDLTFSRKPKCLREGQIIFAHLDKCFGYNYYIFWGLQLFCALYKSFRAQYIFLRTLM